MTPLPQIMVAPNGARLQKTDHPALPITIAEIVAEAAACHNAGAGAIHAHVRDADGAHVLDKGLYRELLAELARHVPDMDVQITTEAVGRYDTDVQMDVALGSGATMVSVATREIIHAGDAAAKRFFHDCTQAGMAVQHILYDLPDCAALQGLMGDDLGQLLFVLGRYDGEGVDQTENLANFAQWQREHAPNADWAVCAFGRHEPHYLKAAAALGGKCRVGFENSRHLSCGSIAPSNAAKVIDLMHLLHA